MNKERKLEIGEAIKEIESGKSRLEAIRDELGEALDEMSDNAKEGDRGQQMQSEFDDLEEAISLCEDAADKAADAKGS